MFKEQSGDWLKKLNSLKTILTVSIHSFIEFAYLKGHMLSTILHAL